MNNKIRLILQKDNGERVEFSPLSLRLQEKILTPYTTVDFTLKGALFGYTYCEIYVDNSLVFKGYKATERVLTTPEGTKTDFVFKSVGNALEINQVEPKVWTNPSFNQLKDYYITPLGDFNTTIANTTMGGEFEVSGGINVWTVFLQFMRSMYGNHPHIDTNGRIQVMSMLKGEEYNASDLPLLSSTYRCKRDGLCTEVYGRFRGSQDFDKLIENSVAVQMGTKRKRLILQENLSILELMDKARSIILQSNLKSVYGLISLSGYSPIALWDTVNFNNLNIPEDFIYVGKKEWKYSVKDGSVTNLYLYPISFVDIYE